MDNWASYQANTGEAGNGLRRCTEVTATDEVPLATGIATPELQRYRSIHHEATLPMTSHYSMGSVSALEEASRVIPHTPKAPSLPGLLQRAEAVQLHQSESAHHFIRSLSSSSAARSVAPARFSHGFTASNGRPTSLLPGPSRLAISAAEAAHEVLTETHLELTGDVSVPRLAPLSMSSCHPDPSLCSPGPAWSIGRPTTMFYGGWAAGDGDVLEVSWQSDGHRADHVGHPDDSAVDHCLRSQYSAGTGVALVEGDRREETENCISPPAVASRSLTRVALPATEDVPGTQPPHPSDENDLLCSNLEAAPRKTYIRPSGSSEESDPLLLPGTAPDRISSQTMRGCGTSVFEGPSSQYFRHRPAAPSPFTWFSASQQTTGLSPQRPLHYAEEDHPPTFFGSTVADAAMPMGTSSEAVLQSSCLATRNRFDSIGDHVSAFSGMTSAAAAGQALLGGPPSIAARLDQLDLNGSTTQKRLSFEEEAEDEERGCTDQRMGEVNQCCGSSSVILPTPSSISGVAWHQKDGSGPHPSGLQLLRSRKRCLEDLMREEREARLPPPAEDASMTVGTCPPLPHRASFSSAAQEWGSSAPQPCGSCGTIGRSNELDAKRHRSEGCRLTHLWRSDTGGDIASSQDMWRTPVGHLPPSSPPSPPTFSPSLSPIWESREAKRAESLSHAAGDGPTRATVILAPLPVNTLPTISKRPL